MSASQLKPGEMRFHQWCEPPLTAGSYRLEATQTSLQLDATDKKSFTTGLDFVVAAPRFALVPTDVYSVFPPKGQAGDFSGTFPHVVLSRRTLPWERTLEPRAQRKDDDTTPWLALLTISAADFGGTFPEVETRVVQDLLTPGGTVAGPRNVEPSSVHEDPKSLCATIDIPVELFRAIAPTRKDLPLLAHVREVNTDAKETAAYLGDGWHSVVVGNRLPRSEPGREVENRSYLVSLEGMTYALPAEHSVLDYGGTLRLAVLSSWSFRCSKSQGFKGAVDRMQVDALRIPWDGIDASPGEAEERVQRALRLGYTAVNHATRLGEKTVSWYRGPLIPVPPEQLSADLCPTADAALGYVPEDGMFDVTYAAAFQLGRLLGLQSGHFAQSLLRFRRAMRSRINQVLERYQLRDSLGLDLASDSKTADAGAVLRGFLRTAGPGEGKDWNSTAISPIAVDKKTLRIAITDDLTMPIPQSVTGWLARLVLLYRVPFVYLLADQRMLEPDEIRFFYLDQNWIEYLLEGACSVGRSTSRDELADQILRRSFMVLAQEQATSVRRDARPAVASDRPAPKAPNWPITGFLMRSPIVEGFQGLEMQAWQDSGKDASHLVEPLRIDRLAPDILLCLFNGRVGRIEIKQPPEGVHFGLTELKEGFGKLHLRGKDGAQADYEVAATMRTASPDVLDIASFAESIRKALSHASPLTSADFAMQMIELPGRAIFDSTNPRRSILDPTNRKR